jgi:8-oxo-dGTP pyrophosphatase MutT (NUDIX family)
MASPDRDRSVPRLAATVLLLREAGEGVEALMIRRHEGMRFLGGAWVFPGGTVDAADRSPTGVSTAARERCRARLEATAVRPLSDEDAVAVYLAACRETFEEIGILLDDLERLVLCGHWITPSAAPRRFDTHFFATPMPPGQTPELDERESTDHVWMTPHALAELASEGLATVTPPTRFTLEQIAAAFVRHGSLAAVLAELEQRPVPAVMPKVVPDEGVVLFPWDPAYPDAPGEGLPLEDPPVPGLPSRLPLPARPAAAD